MDKANRNHEAYKGFEFTFNRGLMQAKMAFFISLGLLAGHLVLWGCISKKLLPEGAFSIVINYYWALLCAALPMWRYHVVDLTIEGQLYSLPAIQMAPWLQEAAALVLSSLKKIFFWTALIYVVGPLAIWRFKKDAKDIEESKHLRGEIGPLEPSKLLKLFAEDKLAVDIPLGEKLRLPVRSETNHVFVVGAPGTGKTLCLSQALSRVRKRGDKALIYDFQGDYLRWFYRPGDVIFNPLDKRSCNWNLFNEIAYKPDIDEYAKSLIPDIPGLKDPYFNRAASQVFAGVLQSLLNTGNGNNKNLWQMLQLSREDLRDHLAGEGTVDAVHHLSQEKTGDNVLSTLKTYARVFGYMTDGKNEDFRIKEWVENQEDRRWVFLTSSQEYEETLKPALTLFIDIASAKLNSLDTDLQRRFVIMLDEFGTLHRLNSIKKLLIGSRKKGGSVWLGVQTIGQIEAIYQNHDSDAIIGSCKTAIVLPVYDNHSGEYLAKKLGEREIRETSETITMGPELVRGGNTLQQRETMKKAVLASEISGLPERNAFVKVSGYPISRTVFEIKQFPIAVPALLLREDLKINQPTPPTRNGPIMDSEPEAPKTTEEEDSLI